MPPGPGDVPIFDAGDSGNPNVIDSNFTVSGLEYGDGGSHDTSLADQVTLQVNGPVTFGLGTTTFVAPATAAVLFGSSSTPISTLRIAYNDAGAGSATAHLDFSASNPTFAAFISDDLSIGRETGAANFATTAADGRLILGSNSAITLGSAAAPATLNIGWSQNTNGGAGSNGSAIGVFDANNGTLTAQLAELNVGRTGALELRPVPSR